MFRFIQLVFFALFAPLVGAQSLDNLSRRIDWLQFSIDGLIEHNDRRTLTDAATKGELSAVDQKRRDDSLHRQANLSSLNSTLQQRATIAQVNAVDARRRLDSAEIGQRIVFVPTVAALRAIRLSSQTDVRYTTSGYYAVNDGGGSQYVWNATSTATHDGGGVLTPTTGSGPGRWLLLTADRVSVLQFGAKRDSTDAGGINRAAFQAAVNYNGASWRLLYIPSGRYLFSTTDDVGVTVGYNANWEGESQDKTILIFPGHAIPIFTGYDALTNEKERNVSFVNFTIRGDKRRFPGANNIIQVGIYCYWRPGQAMFNNALIRNITAEDFVSDPITVLPARTLKIQDCIVRRSAYYQGAAITAGGIDVVLSGNVVDSCKFGMELLAQARPTTMPGMYNYVVCNNTINTQNYALRAYQGGVFEVKGNNIKWINLDNYATPNAVGTGLQFAVNHFDKLSIDNNNVQGYQTQIAIEQGGLPYVFQDTTRIIKHLAIRNNTLAGAGQNAVLFAKTFYMLTPRIEIVGNSIADWYNGQPFVNINTALYLTNLQNVLIKDNAFTQVGNNINAVYLNNTDKVQLINNVLPGRVYRFNTNTNFYAAQNRYPNAINLNNRILQFNGSSYDPVFETTPKLTSGSVALVNGTATVNTAAITATSVILLTPQSGGGTAPVGVSTRTAGTSFTITSSSGTDARTIGWTILN